MDDDEISEEDLSFRLSILKEFLVLSKRQIYNHGQLHQSQVVSPVHEKFELKFHTL